MYLPVKNRSMPHDGGAAEIFQEREAHVGQGRLSVQAGLLLHDGDDLFKRLPLVLRQVEGLLDDGVILNELGGGKAHRQAGGFGVVLHHVGRGVDAPVDGPQGVILVGVVRAKVDAHRGLPVAGDVDGVVDQLVDALVLHRRDGHHRDAQGLLQLVDPDRAPVGPHLIHHVQGQDHGDAQLHELHGQIEIALDVRGIDDVDDAVRLRLQQKAPGDDLLAGIRGEGVDARQVGHGGLRVASDRAVLSVHGDTGEITHVLVGPGELVK